MDLIGFVLKQFCALVASLSWAPSDAWLDVSFLPASSCAALAVLKLTL